MRMTVRYVYVLPIENQNSNSMRGSLFKRLISYWFDLSDRPLSTGWQPTEALLSNELLSVKPLII